jgi:hypothetical protein
MTRSHVHALVALTLAGCCFGGRPGGGAAPPPAVATTLAPGFAPDPMTVTGTAGGPIQASTLGVDCRGVVGLVPNHTFTLTAPFPSLRFSVTAPADTTMAVRSPSGQVFCNDDTNGLNPEITNAFPAGEVQVYVGMYNQSAPPAAYSMTVSQPPAAPTDSPLTLGPTGIPTSCGMTRPFYGPIVVGSSVVLGGHNPYTGPDGRGGFANADANWAPEMGQYVGQRTIITSLENLDNAGCPVVRVAIDNGGYYWRIANMSF